MTDHTQYDVVIVGLGPVGCVAAHLLGHHGICTLVIERDVEPYPLPRAIHLDHEIMRIFQSVGLADLLLPHFSKPAGAMHFGADRAVIRQFQRIVQTDRLGWASDYFFYQPDMEQVLRSELGRRETVTVVTGYALASAEQDDEGVTVTATREDGEVLTATGRYLLGCDGGRSAVRRSLGVRLDDLGFDEPWLVVDTMVDGPVKMPDLTGAPDNVDLQEVMFIVADPARPTSVIPGVGRHRRWEFMMLPSDRPEDFADKEAARPLLAPWVDPEACEIVRCAVYRFHALLAQEWVRGRVFLVGDAAHQTPPFFGEGMCHGLRDAANLAWKLRMVLAGAASPDLLDTYQPERLPQVRSVVEASMRVGRYICTLDPEAAKRRDAEMRAVAGRTAPGYVDIIPPLTAGMLGGPVGEASPVGRRFIQPPVRRDGCDRVLLDSATGGGFVLLAAAPLDAAAIGVEARLAEAAGLKRYAVVGAEAEASSGALVDVSGELSRWFDHYGCRGVVLRPDAYVYGAFSTEEEATAVLQSLGLWIGKTDGSRLAL